jgi:hypothetical protein
MMIATLEGDFRSWRDALRAAIGDTYGIHAEDNINQVTTNPTYVVTTVSHKDALEAEARTIVAMSKNARGRNGHSALAICGFSNPRT